MRFLIRLVLLIPLLLFTGCVQMHTDTTIRDDGSGTCTITYGMSTVIEEALNEMSSFSEMNDEQAPMLDDIRREDMEKIADRHDVSIVSFDRNSDDEQTSLTIKLEFADLAGLSHVLAGSLGDDSNGMKIFRNAEGDYVLKTVELENPEPVEETESTDEPIPLDLDEVANQDPGRQMEILGTLMSAAAELDIRISLTVPGEIISSNAPQVEDRTSIWTINSENMMSAGGDMEPYIVFSSKGCRIDAPDEQ